MLYTHIHLTPPLTVDTTSNTLRLKNGPQTASLLALINSGYESAQFSFPFTFQLFVKKNPQPSQPVVVSNLLFHIENLVLPLQILLNAQTWMTFNQKKKSFPFSNQTTIDAYPSVHPLAVSGKDTEARTFLFLFCFLSHPLPTDDTPPACRNRCWAHLASKGCGAHRPVPRVNRVTRATSAYRAPRANTAAKGNGAIRASSVPREKGYAPLRMILGGHGGGRFSLRFLPTLGCCVGCFGRLV